MSNAYAAAADVTATTGGSFNPLARVVEFFERFGAARRCAAAISGGRQPAKRDLALLELDGIVLPTLSGE